MNYILNIIFFFLFFLRACRDMPRPFPAIFEDVPQPDGTPMPKVFKQIPEAPKYYITLDGDIFSTITETLLKPHLTYNGYKYIWLVTEGPGKYKRFYVHRLVYNAWRGNNLDIVHHIDGDKSNNSLYNLEASSRDLHSYRHYGTPHPRNKFAKNPLTMVDRASLPEDIVPFTKHEQHTFKDVFWSKSQALFYRKRWGCKSGKYVVIKRSIASSGRRAYSYLRDTNNKTVTVSFDIQGNPNVDIKTRRKGLEWMHSLQCDE